MSNDAQDGITTEAQMDAAENGKPAATDEERLHEEAGEKRRREELDHYRLTIGDAEEISVFLVEDLLAAIFQEMQVRSENATLFATSAQQMCRQAFESVDMSSFQPAESLDRIFGPTQQKLGERQQVLKPHSAWSPSPRTRNPEASGPVSSLMMPSPPLLFLRRLLKFLEAQSDRADLELLRFPTSVSTSSLPNKRKLASIENATGFNGDAIGEWCISVDQIAAFLHQLLLKGLVSAVPSTITFVVTVNRNFLDKKVHSSVALSQLQQFVQKALLTAEEEEEDMFTTGKKDLEPLPLDLPDKNNADSESTPRSRIFQTEVPLSKVTFQDVLKGAVEQVQPPEVGPQQELLSSYLEEMPPRAIEMDRRAPGQVGKKAALSAANPTQRAISRKIIMLLTPPPRQGSRWTSVRHKVSASETNTDSVVTITAEADMELHLAGSRHLSTLGSSAERKTVGQSIQTPGAGAIAEDQEMPDAAALSNIFSLGTPRLLSAHELARRNDLLAQLEREAVHAQRRATTTIIASMTLGGPPARCESDEAAGPSQADHQHFQAYVTANSIVTSGSESDGRSGSLSPTRPERSDQPAAPRNRGRINATRRKFELERNTLPFSVSDGNAHVREEQERLAAAMCSPIKRPRPSTLPSPSPETPGRPIRTASTLAHLPQLDTSRLAVGVSAVVQGIEKRGPRRNPSRKSRLQLHNYSAAFDDVDNHEPAINNGGRMPFSPVRTSNAPAPAPVSRGAPGAEESRDCRLPLIPVMSPIKISPHRKHVAFQLQNEADKEQIPVSISPKSHVRQRPSPKVKQPVWESKTRSPPRARNHHFASGRIFRKLQRYSDEEEGSSSARRQKQEEQALNVFRQPMVAPRRNVLPIASELDDDS